MLVQTLLLIVGFVLLIKGADFFVDGSSSVASHFKLSKMLIGLTIVAFGTSAPEFAISIKGLLSGAGDVVVGNVIGSNIATILLIIGLCSMIKPLRVKSNTVKKELPITMLISCLFVVILSDTFFDTSRINEITRSDGVVIVLFFTIFIYYLISMMRSKVNNDEEVDDKPKYGLLKAIILTILGLAGIVFGSDLVVDSAVKIASFLGISERVISITIIAVGTSLPELATSITAVMKGEDDLLVGNIIGSNIFNICVVLGLPILLLGGIIPKSFTSVDLILMALSSVLLFLFSKTGNKIRRGEGLFMLTCYILYYVYLFTA